jgi:threonine/homoserine/homoserine lactone efflux protein
MEFNVLVAVSVIWALAAITPGPNFFITVYTAVDTNRRLSLFTVLGIVTGTFIWSVSGFLGISILFQSVPVVYFFLKIIGGLYLVYVGGNLLLKRKKQIRTQSGKSLSRIGCFRLGLLTNLLNPKTAAFITSLFAATIPAHASLELGFLCVALVCCISALWYSLVSTVFSYDRAKKIYEKQKQKIEKIAGAIFVGFGLKLMMTK